MPPADSLPTSTAMPVGESHSLNKGTLSMGIQIDQWNFEGPYSNAAPIKKQSGVYAVLTRPRSGGQYSVVDVGESGDVRTRLDTHDRTACWNRNNAGELAVAVYYCDERTRMTVEATIRRAFNPPCGQR
jgi:hypothetical protein